MCGTIYQVLCFKNAISEKELKEAAKILTDKYPILHSVFKQGFLKDKWMIVKNYDIDSLFFKYTLKAKAGEEFFEEAHSFFLSLLDKTIDNRKDFPWRFYIITNDNIDRTCVYIAFHHLVSDGIGWMELIKELGAKYKELLSGQQNVSEQMILSTGSRVLVPDIDGIYLQKVKETADARKKTDDELKKLKVTEALLPTGPSHVNYSEVHIHKNDFEIDEIHKLIEKLGLNRKITLNDFLLYINSLLNYRLKQSGTEPEEVTFAGYRVNNRKYMKNPQEKYLANYSFMQLVCFTQKDMQDKQKIFDAIDKAKEEMSSLDALVSLNNIKDVPMPLFRIGSKKILAEIGTALCQGVSTTNMGRIDSYFDDFGSGLEDAFIIPCGFSVGYPLLCTSSFGKKITFIFIRYNDNDISQKVNDEFVKIIDELRNY